MTSGSILRRFVPGWTKTAATSMLVTLRQVRSHALRPSPESERQEEGRYRLNRPSDSRYPGGSKAQRKIERGSIFILFLWPWILISDIAQPDASAQQSLGSLLVSEIMYHPPADGQIDGDEFEFLEIKNVGSTALELGNAYFTNGITYAFTPGTVVAPSQFYVLASNPVQFQSKYPDTEPDGRYTGRLSNAGENLKLVDAAGSTIFSLSYLDQSPWPATPDGEGFSLVPANPNTNPDLNDPGNWRASAQIGGSPGADDPPTASGTVWITEALTHTDPPFVDAIELHNPTASGIDVSYWFLTDDRTNPTKFQIAPGTVIPAGGYLLFTESDFNPTPGIAPSFSLNSQGEEVYLYAADSNGDLLGFSDGFSFGAAENGVSFGRYTTSNGEIQQPAQTSNSLGTANQGPRVGSIVINEIQYHPADGDEEFIELKNITSTPVPLYDPSFPNNPWRLNGVGFSFPAGTVVPANGLVVVSGSDPGSFRAKNAIGQGMHVLGPYSGVLQDSGERLQLLRPDTPDISSTSEVIVPYIVVDEVRYNDKNPWPVEADGLGPSLERIRTSAYGNDPINWRASSGAPSPGFDNDETPAQTPSAPEIRVHPTDQTVTIGLRTTFVVTAVGTGTLEYQWYKDGLRFEGARDHSLVIGNVQSSDVGDYHVIVSNASGSVSSGMAALTVQTPSTIQSPAITQQPRSQTAAPGGSVSFTVTAVGSAPLDYQWHRDGAEISGAPETVLTLHNLHESDEGDYTVRVSNSGGSITSTVATLTVSAAPSGEAPVIVAQPVSQTVDAGDSAQFTVFATGAEPLFFRWFKNGDIIEEANGGLLIFHSARLRDGGVYGASVSNAQGSATSEEVQFIVNPSEGNQLPEIVAQPTSIRAAAGDTIIFTVLANGSGPFTYQWRKNRIDLDGQGSAVLRLTAVETTDAGRYSVVVGNEQGNVISTEATLAVSADSETDLSVPTFTTHPSSQSVAIGDRASFSIQTEGAPPLFYQWKKDGVAVEGATNVTLVLEAVTQADDGEYNVSAENEFGAATSISATLKALFPPRIVSQLEDKTVEVGEKVEFTVATTGSGPLRYEWQKDGAAIPGAIEKSLVLERVKQDESGKFRVLVCNAVGSAVSTQAMLTVLSVPSSAKNDLNGDGSSDVVFQDNRGFLAAWLMDGTTLKEARFLSPNNVGDLSWRLAGTGDLNSNRHVDLVFQHVDGRLAVWEMNGIELKKPKLVFPESFGAPGWNLAAVGDFNRDRKDDFVFQNSSGAISVWFMDGADRVSSTLTNPTGPDDSLWKVVATGDFDADGMEDLVFQHANSSIAIWLMTGIRLRTAVITNPSESGNREWRVVGTGDYNSDGTADLLFQHESKGTVAVWLMEGTNLKEPRLLNPAEVGGTWRVKPSKLNHSPWTD